MAFTFSYYFNAFLDVYKRQHYAGLKYKGPKHYVGTYTSSGIGIAPVSYTHLNV